MEKGRAKMVAGLFSGWGRGVAQTIDLELR